MVPLGPERGGGLTTKDQKKHKGEKQGNFWEGFVRAYSSAAPAGAILRCCRNRWFHHRLISARPSGPERQGKFKRPFRTRFSDGFTRHWSAGLLSMVPLGRGKAEDSAK